jgi:DNA-binding GntR family transcriptional regulator
MVEEVMRVWVYQKNAMASAIKPRPRREDGARVAAEHRAILEAIRRRDVDDARALLRQHFLVSDL